MMIKRIVIKFGDIFIVRFEDYQKYFQYVADDMTQLNSRVIRAFKEKYPVDSVPDLTEVAHGEIEFYAHTSIRPGIKLLWILKNGCQEKQIEKNLSIFAC
jgi:hypothetical protein